ncbi:MAG: hypothetical protein QXU06_00905 [Candidatus Bathyarchaeia archaeon]
MVDIAQVLGNMLGSIISAIPSVIAAIIVILIGYGVGTVVGKAVDKIIEGAGIERAFDRSRAGKAFRDAGLDFSTFIGSLLKAFVVVLSLILAIQILSATGELGLFGTYLGMVAEYLPRILGGVIVLVFGIVFVDFLASFVGKMIAPMFPEEKSEIADMLKNLLLIGLVAFVIMVALDIMRLWGNMVYPLILGFVVIGAGIALTDGLVKSITDDHPEFRDVAGYAKFVLYAIFLLIGSSAIFAEFSGITAIVANISWAFAIAFAAMMAPIVYAIFKRMKASQ